MASKHPILATENHLEYEELQREYADLWKPANCQERDIVQDIVDARWRLRRAKREEQKLLNLEMAYSLEEAEQDFDEIDAGSVEAMALKRASLERALENLDRYERRYERTYHRSIQLLLKLRAENPFPPAPPLAPSPQPPPPDPEPAPAPSTTAQPNEPTSRAAVPVTMPPATAQPAPSRCRTPASHSSRRWTDGPFPCLA